MPKLKSTNFPGPINLNGLRKTELNPSLIQITVDLPIVQSTDDQTLEQIFPANGFIALFTTVAIVEPVTGATPTLQAPQISELQSVPIDVSTAYATNDIIFIGGTDLVYRLGSADLVPGKITVSFFGCSPDVLMTDLSIRGTTAFGAEYTRAEDLSETFSSIPFSTTPTTKLSLQETFEAGTYIVLVNYKIGMDKISRSFVGDVQIDGVTVNDEHIERVNSATDRVPVTRTFSAVFDDGVHDIDLRFGISSVTATASISGASITIWRAT